MIGPGIITSAADNDAGGITTYSAAGALFGYNLLWVIVVITFVLIIVQEMAARMGTVTQKGLGELIREQFGVKWTLFALSVLLVANLATTIAEFAGIAAATELLAAASPFNFPFAARYLGVPLAAAGVWFLVVRGNFKTVERVFLTLAVLYATYIISGIMARPSWSSVIEGITRPSFAAFDTQYLLFLIALVGTTITPWMQFFLQATVVDKGVDVRHYKYQKADVIVGSILTDLVSAFIIIAAAATLHHAVGGPTVVRPEELDASDLAIALKPFAGGYATVLFAFGLLGASLLAAAVLPLSTAYTFTEAFGFEIGISRKWKEAPAFYGIYTSAIVIGALVALIPHFNPVLVMIWSQFVNGLLLPVVLIFMLKLINNKAVMGQYTNSKIYNIIVWITAAALIVFSIIMVLTSIFPTLFQ
ncbi:MAG TPA: Nramp family divalent metal transporter [Armatimonadota bacterium]|nr:Nramp family divalent metal transporter [Armatimonadota bacterium]HPP74238.1 Nramp family divalent metal transporter [Armatimonadota bacterium]